MSVGGEAQTFAASAFPAFSGCILTLREMATVRHMARGLTYAEVAKEMDCTASTVRTLLHSAYGRLGVSTISQALVLCTRVGWLDEVPEDGAAVEHADKRVTWAQRLYLEAFDQFLRSGEDPTDVERTAGLRDAALTGMYKETATKRPQPRRANVSPIERIADTLRQLEGPSPGRLTRV